MDLQFFIFITIALAFSLSFNFLLLRRKRLLDQKIKNLIEEARSSLLKLEASETELKQNLEFKKRVIDILIHDIRSPIIFIHKLASNLQNLHDSLEKEEIYDLQQEIVSTSFQIHEFVSDMLQWINASQHYFKPTSTTFSLNSFFVDDCKLYFDIAKSKGLLIELKAMDSYTIKIDRTLFKIIVRNLLDNAIKNTVKGKITLNGYTDSGNMQKIFISDTGTGMPIEKVFEIQQGIITKKSSDSTQIGFRIVHDLMKKLNGTVAIQSDSNTGTIVILEFPVY